MPKGCSRDFHLHHRKDPGHGYPPAKKPHVTHKRNANIWEITTVIHPRCPESIDHCGDCVRYRDSQPTDPQVNIHQTAKYMCPKGLDVIRLSSTCKGKEHRIDVCRIKTQSGSYLDQKMRPESEVACRWEWRWVWSRSRWRTRSS